MLRRTTFTLLCLGMITLARFLRGDNLQTQPDTKYQLTVVSSEDTASEDTESALMVGPDPKVEQSKVLMFSNQTQPDTESPVTAVSSEDNGKALMVGPDDPKVEQPKILMFSYLFGKKTAQRPYLKLFCESAAFSGIDIVLVGDYPLPFDPPSNVRHVQVAWDNLLDRIRDRVLNGEDPSGLRRAKGFYKVADFKPLFAHLFPELVHGYDWWGHLDVDMVLGDLKHFLPVEDFSAYDVITGNDNQYTWGPFTLYRNSPFINELFRRAKKPLRQIFMTNRGKYFDEWGGRGHRSYESTMSGIVKEQLKLGQLRWRGGLPGVWDGSCTRKVGLCDACHMIRDEQKQMLLNNAGSSIVWCHFQDTKKEIEKSLANEETWEIIRAGRYTLNFTQKAVVAS